MAMVHENDERDLPASKETFKVVRIWVVEDLMTSIRLSDLARLEYLLVYFALAANSVGKTIANLWFILAVMGSYVLGERGLYTPLEAPKKNEARFAIVLQTAVLSHSRRLNLSFLHDELCPLRSKISGNGAHVLASK